MAIRFLCASTFVLVGLFVTNQAAISAIISGPIAAPTDVTETGYTNTSVEGFDEAQNVTLSPGVSVDDGIPIPSGAVVDSHMLLLNTGGTSVTSSETFCFDGHIVGVMSDEDGALEIASTAQLGGSPTYPTSPTSYRGIEPTLGDDYSSIFNSLTISTTVTSPGDWIRVVTNKTKTTGVTFSLSGGSKTVGNTDPWRSLAIGAGDILTVGSGHFRLPNNPASSPGSPGVLVNATEFGLSVSTSTGYIEIDALSYGNDIGSRFVFSVDEEGIGCPAAGPCSVPSAVYSEGACSCSSVMSSCPASTKCEASADAFLSEPSPPGGNLNMIDGEKLGLVEPNPPGGSPLDGDTIDAIDVNTTTEDLMGKIYFSVDRSTAVSSSLGSRPSAAAVYVRNSCINGGAYSGPR